MRNVKKLLHISCLLSAIHEPSFGSDLSNDVVHNFTSTNTPSSFIEILPKETQLHILSFVHKDDINNLMALSHLFNHLMQENTVWYGYSKREKYILPNNFNNNKFLNYEIFFHPYKKSIHFLSNPLDFKTRVIYKSNYVNLYNAETKKNNFRLLSLSEKAINIILKKSSENDSNFDNTQLVKKAHPNLKKNKLSTPIISNNKKNTRDFFKVWNESDSYDIITISKNEHYFIGNAQNLPENNKKFAYRCNLTDFSIQSLGALNGGNESYAELISADGRIIWGWATDGMNDNKKTAFIWTEKLGMISLTEYLIKREVNFINDIHFSKISGFYRNDQVIKALGFIPLDIQPGDNEEDKKRKELLNQRKLEHYIIFLGLDTY